MPRVSQSNGHQSNGHQHDHHHYSSQSNRQQHHHHHNTADLEGLQRCFMCWSLGAARGGCSGLRRIMAGRQVRQQLQQDSRTGRRLTWTYFFFMEADTKLHEVGLHCIGSAQRLLLEAIFSV
mmetsp:Transcript_17238/g.36021  ORF Transcript_17238/g.36021 Transcript_17238/m.36021 type:complete len:122 (+) Transcript_17238:320-685(+)